MFQIFSHPPILSSHQKGFSTLMALGTIGILLIIVTGLATTYIREMKLSRTSYDDVVASAGAEGMFEYAMLKIRNHREGFADTVSYTDIDGSMLVPVTERSKKLKSSYSIKAEDTRYSTTLIPNTHLVLPLFTAHRVALSGLSSNPTTDRGTENTEGLNISLGDMSWTIVAMSGSESIGLTGSGNITSATLGIIRHKASRCYNHIDGSEISCSQANFSLGDEELEYFYDENIAVPTFLANMSDPYIMVFNNTPESQDVEIRASKPFALPTLSVRAEAQKSDSVQVFEFTEDKSKYYDALKYGVYNSN